MKIVKEETDCEICGELFQGEFIQHESPADDFPNEQDWLNEFDGEYELEELTYPHLHEQPTVNCHICPNCRTLPQHPENGEEKQ